MKLFLSFNVSVLLLFSSFAFAEKSTVSKRAVASDTSGLMMDGECGIEIVPNKGIKTKQVIAQLSIHECYSQAMESALRNSAVKTSISFTPTKESADREREKGHDVFEWISAGINDSDSAKTTGKCHYTFRGFKGEKTTIETIGTDRYRCLEGMANNAQGNGASSVKLEFIPTAAVDSERR